MTGMKSLWHTLRSMNFKHHAVRSSSNILDRVYKQAELMIEDQQVLSDLLDKAFVKMGRGTEALYDVQDHGLALIRMMAAWMRREYIAISPKALIALTASLIYLVNPFDLVSDFIPFAGYLDDLTVISYVVSVFNKEIERFMTWEEARDVN